MEHVHIERLRATIRGAVQGVGFRPFVFRLAHECGLGGWVLNSAQGVFIEAEGPKAMLDGFLVRIQSEKPHLAYIQSLESSFLDPVGYSDFVIRSSEGSGEKSVVVLPDIATCPDCLNELFDPRNRRYLYPFTNCTHCGPRFTIIESLPYDRANTSMRIFEMCDRCRHEYEDPRDRRFHAQPNACPECGPRVELWDQSGRVLAERHDAILTAAKIIRDGGILAVKGIGGFHLMVDARSGGAVRRLRQRKHREEKPFAVMYPGLEQVAGECALSETERRLLLAPESPIVLLEKKEQDSGSMSRVADTVAPGNPYLGVMLPYSPLHHILMRELGFPVVATSGNLSDEPICTDEQEAGQRLSEIADSFLVHNRPIVRHVDDSVVRIMSGRELVVRRARGYAPLPVHLHADGSLQLLAVGAHLKNTIAMNIGNNVVVSQHIGDLETQEAFDAFRKVVEDVGRMYGRTPEAVVCDLHPDYLSTRFARELPIPTHGVQHHYAHVTSCMAENDLEGSVLGVSWDGTGYGLDGTIWGGEFLRTSEDSFQRVASLRPFALPGGDKAIREPRRAAIGVLYEILGNEIFERSDLAPVRSFDEHELVIIQRMLSKAINSPVTSSAGRLFDAVASIIGLRQRAGYEGQAAMELEYTLSRVSSEEPYEFALLRAREEDHDGLRRITEGIHSLSYPQSEIPNPQSKIVIDWAPIIRGVLDDAGRGRGAGLISARFHTALTEIIVSIAGAVGEERIVLSGGCFQNKFLTERTVQRLREEGFRPYWHQRVPPNDGGIALGQINAVMKMRDRDYAKPKLSGHEIPDAHQVTEEIVR